MDFLADFMVAHFWIAVGQIILIDVLLGGDNAVVIALACRKLPEHQRTKGIVLGTAAAIALRVILIMFALSLLRVPVLKLVGALLLFWIGIKLLLPDDGDHADVHPSERLWGAVKTIVIADAVMSIDNVIGIAAAAQQAGEKHELILVIFGLLASVPIIVLGSQIVLKMMERFPIIVTLGSMLLGWIAGGMFVTDPVFVNTDKWLWMPKLGTTDAQGLAEISKTLYWAAHIGGALLVLALGKFIASRRPAVAAH